MKAKLNGVRVAKAEGGRKNNYIMHVINGKNEFVILPRNIAVAKGELLIGELEFGEVERERQEDAPDQSFKKGDKFTRWEATSYLSLKDQVEVLKANAEFKQVQKELATEYKLSEQDIMSLVS